MIEPLLYAIFDSHGKSYKIRWRLAPVPPSHRPAKIMFNGIPVRVWTDDKGNVHRESGPAIELEQGDKIWVRNSLQIRLEGLRPWG